MKKPDENANILTYLQWRGDLTFSQSSFCQIDSLILCCLSYLNWDGIAAGRTLSESVSLQDAIAQWNAKPEEQQITRSPLDRTLLELLSESARFRDVRLFRYEAVFSERRQQQFSAVSFLLGKSTVYAAFRGTDNTLTGWREDFNMSFLSETPSQQAAAAYLRSLLETDLQHVLVGGHSKGGNLAVYAAAHAPELFLSKVEAVYNNDGPGFSGNLLQSSQYLRLKERVHTYVPQASIVGMLLEHEEEYQVVYSNQKGFLQHDPYSWCVMRNDWYYLDHITEASQLLDVSLKKWILGMTPEERKRLTGGIFHVLQSGTDAKTVEDLRSGKDTLSGILQGWKDTDPETRRFMQQMVLELILTVRDYAALHHQKSPEDILQSVRRRRKS